MTEVLSAAHITKSYGERTIIRDINVHLNEQEIVCLLGVSGVGKTTLFHILSGLSRPDSGSVMLNGREITGQPGKISYMLQKDLLLPYKRIIDNVALPLTIRGMKKQKARETAAAYFEQFGLAGTEFEYPAQLSGGMRQRTALLRTYLSSEGVRFWTSRSAPSTRSRKAPSMTGIWISCRRSASPLFSSPMISTRPLSCQTGSTSCPARRGRSRTRSRLLRSVRERAISA